MNVRMHAYMAGCMSRLRHGAQILVLESDCMPGQPQTYSPHKKAACLFITPPHQDSAAQQKKGHAADGTNPNPKNHHSNNHTHEYPRAAFTETSASRTGTQTPLRTSVFIMHRLLNISIRVQSISISVQDFRTPSRMSPGALGTFGESDELFSVVE
jgi:hypothetical protein